MNKKSVLFAAFFVVICTALLFGCSISGDNQAVPTPEPRNIGGESIMADSIVYASDMANLVQGCYETADREAFIITNQNAKLRVGLCNEDILGLSEIRNGRGDILLKGGMTAFAENDAGDVYITTRRSCRMNTSRMGYYYYEMNIRGLEFIPEESRSDEVNLDGALSVVPGTAYGNDLENIKCANGTISGKISNTNDPYLYFNEYIQAKGYNTIVFDITYDGKCTSGELFYNTSLSDSGNFSAEERIAFDMNGNGKKQTVSITYLLEGYEKAYTACGFRIDFNSGCKKGDTFTIDNIRLAKVDTGVQNLNCGIEHTLHTYSDKVNSDLRIIYDKEISNVARFGYRYEIPANTVKAIQIGTDKGVFSDIGLISGNIEYLGFNVKNNGILGLILQNDGISQATVELKDGVCTVEIFINLEGTHEKKSSSDFGHRIYTSDDTDFEKLAYEAYCERNPLTFEVTGTFSDSGMRYVGYDTRSGAYTFRLGGTGFNEAYKYRQNDYIGGTVRTSGDTKDRKVYICCRGSSGCLEKAVVLDENMLLLPIEAEVCKNFCGEYEEPYYDPKDTGYGDTIYPLVINAGEQSTHTMLDVYQKWGLNNIKQISSIAFHIGYYHLSTGTTESNCIAPYFVYGRDGWTLPDFRGCSGYMWSDQPQFNSVGRLRFLSYDKKSITYHSEYTDAEIKSSGPVYADIDYSYKSYDGSFAYTLTHTEFPQTDENRTYYTMEIEVLKDVTISDVRKNFTLFNFDGRFGYFKNTAYLSSDGTVKIIKNDDEKETGSIYKLQKGSSYVTYYNTNEGSIENFAFILKDYNFKIGGNKWNGCLVFRNSFADDNSDLNFMEISLDEGKLSFKKGDKLVLHFILLPYGVLKQDNYDNVQYVYEDSVLNPWRIKSCAKGTVVEDGYLARVKCIDDEAEFTVTGSRNCNVVRVDGFTKLTKPVIQELVNGEWVEYRYNYTDYDGYQVNYTKDGYFSYSFVISMENYSDERTFRVAVG